MQSFEAKRVPDFNLVLQMIRSGLGSADLPGEAPTAGALAAPNTMPAKKKLIQ
jgi:hypothetical protein